MDQRDLAIPARVLAQGLHAGHVDLQGRQLTPQLAEAAQRVAEVAGPSHPAVAVAWLHASIAQGGLTARELEAAFGASITSAVVALTPRTGEAEAEHHARILGNELAAQVWQALPCARQELVRAS